MTPRIVGHDCNIMNNDLTLVLFCFLIIQLLVQDKTDCQERKNNITSPRCREMAILISFDY